MGDEQKNKCLPKCVRFTSALNPFKANSIFTNVTYIICITTIYPLPPPPSPPPNLYSICIRCFYVFRLYSCSYCINTHTLGDEMYQYSKIVAFLQHYTSHFHGIHIRGGIKFHSNMLANGNFKNHLSNENVLLHSVYEIFASSVFCICQTFYIAFCMQYKFVDATVLQILIFLLSFFLCMVI